MVVQGAPSVQQSKLNAVATEEKGAGSGKDEEEPWAGPTRKKTAQCKVHRPQLTGPHEVQHSPCSYGVVVS